MKKIILLIAIAFWSLVSFGQMFEEAQIDNLPFDSVRVKVGADFALQYQMLEHSADSALIPLGKGLNIPTANMNLSSELAKGIRVNLTIYLSSRHHLETWVKDGYLLIDQLPFIKSTGLTNIMNYLTVKAGVMEINFGDQHFRRSDNGNVIRNRFVGNYIMESFTTAPAVEIYFRPGSWLFMGGLTNNNLDPVLSTYSNGKYTAYNMTDELAFYGKAGFDQRMNDLRLRATVSALYNNKNHRGSLYFGDRTGSRYYLIMNKITNQATDINPENNHTSGNWGPGFSNQLTSVMLNLFADFKGIELFGTYESATGNTPGATSVDFDFKQYAIEGLYHFGGQSQYYAGARYNYVKNDKGSSVNRIQVGGGWNWTKNIIVKLEYVNQQYDKFPIYGNDAKFNGFMFEAGVSF